MQSDVELRCGPAGSGDFRTGYLGVNILRAMGLCGQKSVNEIFCNTNTDVPASVMLEGEYGLDNVCVGVPVKLGKNGIEDIIELQLSDTERNELHASATVYQESLTDLGM